MKDQSGVSRNEKPTRNSSMLRLERVMHLIKQTGQTWPRTRLQQSTATKHKCLSQPSPQPKDVDSAGGMKLRDVPGGQACLTTVIQTFPLTRNHVGCIRDKLRVGKKKMRQVTKESWAPFRSKLLHLQQVKTSWTRTEK